MGFVERLQAESRLRTLTRLARTRFYSGEYGPACDSYRAAHSVALDLARHGEAAQLDAMARTSRLLQTAR